ncbi:MAG: ABC transporter permease [Candidatus Omnitrophica bacterium]|nr:ABC transporter permease [Candidatus Omnitrophota bacterium]
MKNESLPLKNVRYLPDNSIRLGFWRIFPEIFQEIKDNRWLIFQLFKRDFTAAYKQSMMGFFWAFVVPLISIGTFLVLNRSGIFVIGNISVPYPVYAVLGMAFWQLFSSGLVATSQSLVLAGPMISKINFSKKSLVFASIGQGIVAFGVQMTLLIVLLLVYHVTPSLSILFLPLLMIPILFLTLGIGFFLSLINSVMRDIANILPMFLTFLMFLTPVLYEKPAHGLLKQINEVNPMYYFVLAARDLALNGQIKEWHGFISACAASVVIFFVSLFVFHLTETRITERV